MTIDMLKSNAEQEKKILETIILINEEIRNAISNEEKNFLESSLNSLTNQIKIVNDAIPKILDVIVTEKKTAKREVKAKVSEVKTSKGIVFLKNEEKQRFIKELNINEELLKKLRKIKLEPKKEEEVAFKKPSKFVGFCSRLFYNQAMKIQPSFKSVDEGLKRANIPFLINSYISTMLFVMLISFLLSILVAILTSFFKISMEIGSFLPKFELLGMSTFGMRLITNLFVAFFIPVITFLIFYFYPIAQASSIKGKIDNELPFVTIHMSSIAGSGVEPSKIFSILAASPEYPAISKEIRKLINQINLYGYDLVTALHTTAKLTSSEKFQGLLNGLATNISAGGDLKNYLDKRAEDMLLDYKLERKQYSSIAETSMDIYIGVLVAAPLIFMVLLIIMNFTGMGVGLSMPMLSFLIIAGISVLNIGFLMFLQLRQPA